MADQADGLLSKWLRKRRIEKVKPYLSGRILDYGCGVGALCELCTPENYVGVDIDNDSLDIAKSRYSDFRFMQDMPDETFDTIVLLALIEHIKKPAILLKTLKDKLDSNGNIILTTPHPKFALVHELGAKLGIFSQHASEEHEKLINYKNMRALADETGLNINTYKRFLYGANQLFVLSISKT